VFLCGRESFVGNPRVAGSASFCILGRCMDIMATGALESFVRMYAHLKVFRGLGVAGCASRFRQFVGMRQILYIVVAYNAIQLPVAGLLVFVVTVKTFFGSDRAKGQEKKEKDCQ